LCRCGAGNGARDEGKEKTGYECAQEGIGHGSPGSLECEDNGKPSGAEAQAALRLASPALLSGCANRPVSGMTILFQESTMDNPGGTAANRFCAGCGAPLFPDTRFCPSCGKSVEPLGAQAVPAGSMPSGQPPQQFPAQAANFVGTNPQGLKCPRCGSTQVQTAKRGWKWTTGMIGSGNTIATCLQCGNKF
jgi:RNA polymerase subunit RPABC4/transcription elongation factor Spt4